MMKFQPETYRDTDSGDLIAAVPKAPEAWPLPEGLPQISVVLSQPRLCFTDQAMALVQSLVGLPNTRVHSMSGFPWEKALSQGIEDAMASNPDYLVFCDYDGLFTKADLLTIINAMQEHPEYGAIYPIQAHRHRDGALVEPDDINYSGELTETPNAHFGLTVIRRQVFEHMPQPWFWSMPNPVTNTWSYGGMDADIFFWEQCRKAGIRVARHNGVQIGHMELCTFWLDENGKRIYQTLSEYRKQGKPKNATWRGPKLVEAEAL